MIDKKLYFIVETLAVLDGKKLKSLTPDKDGYYDVPITVLGAPTRRNVIYRPESVLSQITDNKSAFNMILRHGNLYGEYGHPITKDVERTATVDEKCVSHHFKAIYLGEDLKNQGQLIMGKVKPHGPYGQYVKENFEDGNMNTAFSLRTLCSRSFDRNGMEIRDVKMLVTFDYVGCPGYEKAAKRYAPGNESFTQEIEVTPRDFYRPDGTIAMESFTDERIIELFGGSSVKINERVVGLHYPGEKSILANDGMKRSLMHSMLQKR